MSSARPSARRGPGTARQPVARNPSERSCQRPLRWAAAESMSVSRDRPGRTISMSESTVTKRSYSPAIPRQGTAAGTPRAKAWPREPQAPVEFGKIDSDEVHSLPQCAGRRSKPGATSSGSQTMAISNGASGSLSISEAIARTAGAKERAVGRKNECGPHGSGVLPARRSRSLLLTRAAPMALTG